jgi:uncharacterized protein YcfJ
MIFQKISVSRLIFIVVFFVISGCATTDATRTRTEGTAVGVATGAATGAAVGAVAGAIAGDAGTGALVGAGVGGVVGGIAGYFYGDSVVTKKETYAKNESKLQLAMADIDKNTEVTKEYNSQLAEEISNLQEIYKSLESEEDERVALKEKLQQQKSKNSQLLAKSEKHLSVLKTKTVQYKKLIAKEEKRKQSGNDKQLIASVKTSLVSFNSEQQTLQNYINQLKQIDRRRVY